MAVDLINLAFCWRIATCCVGIGTMDCWTSYIHNTPLLYLPPIVWRIHSLRWSCLILLLRYDRQGRCCLPTQVLILLGVVAPVHHLHHALPQDLHTARRPEQRRHLPPASLSKWGCEAKPCPPSVPQFWCWLCFRTELWLCLRKHFTEPIVVSLVVVCGIWNE